MRAAAGVHSRRFPVLHCYPDCAVAVPNLAPYLLAATPGFAQVHHLAAPAYPLTAAALAPAGLVFPLPYLSPPAAAPSPCPSRRAKARSIHAPSDENAWPASKHPRCRLARRNCSSCARSQLAQASQPLPLTS